MPALKLADADGRIEVRRWEALADGTMDAVSATLYEMRFHDEAKRSQVLGNRPWCVGDAMSLADIAIACHLGFINLRVPHYFPSEKYPHLARLWKTMEARELFKTTAPPSG